MGTIIHLTTEGLAHFQVSFDSLADTSSHPPSDDETEQTTAAAPTSAPIVSRHSNLAFAPPAFESRFPSVLPQPTLLAVPPSPSLPIGPDPSYGAMLQFMQQMLQQKREDKQQMLQQNREDNIRRADAPAAPCRARGTR